MCNQNNTSNKKQNNTQNYEAIQKYNKKKDSSASQIPIANKKIQNLSTQENLIICK